jgi:hypothetical protein
MADHNRTRSFLGQEFLWPGLTVELEYWWPGDRQRRIVICGTGHGVVQAIAPDKREVRHEFRLPRAEQAALLGLIVDNDLVAIQPAARDRQPGEAHMRLSLANSNRRHEIISTYERSEDARFIAIAGAIERHAAQAERQAPAYTGPLAYRYHPRQGLAPLGWKARKLIYELRFLGWRDVGRFIHTVLFGLYGARYSLVWFLALLVGAYFWAEVSPALTYGMGGGIAHGFFWLQNSVLAIFTGRLIWAPHTTGGWYTAGFLIGALLIPTVLNAIFQAAAFIIGDWLRRP